jgi:N-acetylmuramic acid 6-phosphate etherase
MKAGTAQKMVLNMISTSLMIKLGRVKGNKMVDMKLSNQKLKARALRMVMEECGVSQERAEELLFTYGNVRAAISNCKVMNEEL